MSARKAEGRFEFDPYKRPPAARLLAVLTTAVLLGWILRAGDRSQVSEFHRDPAKYAARLDRIARHGVAFDVVVALFVVTIVVFAVDGMTSLFSRWLTEREQPEAENAAPASHSPGRADALLGPPPAPPPET